jgi:TPR repeat protein
LIILLRVEKRPLAVLGYLVLLNIYFMKSALALLLISCALLAQDKPAEPDPAGLQPIANPNDERLNVFRELEAKAALNDGKALAEIGRYYCDGRFPVLQNIEKGKGYFFRGASMGDAECATRMWEYTNKNGDQNDPEHVIETEKWHVIWTSLRRVDSRFVTRPDHVSEASWAEAKARAATFLAGVKVSAPPVKGGEDAPDVGSGFRKSRVPSLRFESLSLFDTHRKNVCAAYMKAAFPIYNKGDIASDEEKAAFTVAAAELARLQAYIGKARRLSLSSKSNAALRAVNSEKMRECYSKMASAKIATALPVTRAELNEASIYINALGQLMQLPVSMGE